MKRIVICCDGTWNTKDAKNPTNVVKLAAMVEPTGGNIPQIVHYDEGVGTRVDKITRALSGAFGWGLMDKVESSYKFLCDNYEPGDQIYIFGFSRGAFTARSLAGLIRNCGIPTQGSKSNINDAFKLYQDRKQGSHPDAEASLKFRAAFSPQTYMGDEELEWRKHNVPEFNAASVKPLKIEYIGVWDTVGSLGLPNHFFISGLFNKKYQFHDTDLSNIVESARHVVAIDERRRSYEPALWSNLDKRNLEKCSTCGEADAPYQQIWMPGDHSSEGGGGEVAGLSERALIWVAQGAQRLGLTFNEAAFAKHGAGINDRAPLVSSKPSFISKIMVSKDREGPAAILEVGPSAITRWNTAANDLPELKLYRPKPLSKVASAMDRKPD